MPFFRTPSRVLCVRRSVSPDSEVFSPLTLIYGVRILFASAYGTSVVGCGRGGGGGGAKDGVLLALADLLPKAPVFWSSVKSTEALCDAQPDPADKPADDGLDEPC